MKRTISLLSCVLLLLVFASCAWATIHDPVKVEQGKLSGASGRNPGVKRFSSPTD